MTPTTKPWWLEREFLAMVGSVIGGIVLVFKGQTTEGIALIGAGIGSFNISRGIAKGGTPK